MCKAIKNICSALARLDNKGTVAIEYALLGGLISVVIITALLQVQTELAYIYNEVIEKGLKQASAPE
jgi:Flp pilus assembly pilin Flp